MVIRLLLAAIVIIGITWLIRYIRRQPAEKRPKLIIKYGFYLLALVLIGLVMTGKVHWITAGIAAAIPFLIKMSSIAIRFAPMFQFWKSTKQQYDQAKQSSDTTKTSSSKMTVKQAKEVFGIDSVDSVEQITKRHRELMQKNHPDRGGSDFIAAQINQAKDVLIDHIK